MLRGFVSKGLELWLEGLPNYEDAAISICRMPLSEALDWEGVGGECSDAMLTPMVPRRRAEFRHGRLMAHLARERLGQPAAPVLRADREPVWPDGSRGSITHAKDVAAAIVTTGERSFGVDIERLGRIDTHLHHKLFTAGELDLIQASASDHASSILFAAKEAGYKAIYPLGRKFIGFHEAEIDLDEGDGRFAIRYLGDHAPNRDLNRGEGHYTIIDEHVFALFVI